MRKIIPMLFIAFFTWSCASQHAILFKSDGTAYIETMGEQNFWNSLSHSKVISEIDTVTEEGFTFYRGFTISNIDSIGEFLPFHNAGFLTVKNFGDSILVTTGNTPPYNSQHTFRLMFALSIRSEFPMEAYDTKGKRIRKRGPKGSEYFYLTQSVRQQLKGKKNIYVKLKRK